MSLPGNQGLGLRSVYLRESLQASGRVLGRALGRQPGTSPARAEHRVSVEHAAEPINKGGGWRARAGGALRATGWRLPCSAAAVWAAPGHLTLPLWADFLDGCQGGERILRLDPC